MERYRRVMGVNLDGVVFGTHAALAGFDACGRGGAIVAMASLAGLTGGPGDPLYAANKHAVVGLARSLRPALADRGVPIVPTAQVAGAVLELFAGEMTGECWFVQAGREAAAFRFRGIPGRRIDEQKEVSV